MKQIKFQIEASTIQLYIKRLDTVYFNKVQQRSHQNKMLSSNIIFLFYWKGPSEPSISIKTIGHQ